MHRADSCIPELGVIELQHSSISVEEIERRDDFYGDPLWIFDATEAYENDRISVEDLWQTHQETLREFLARELSELSEQVPTEQRWAWARRLVEKIREELQNTVWMQEENSIAKWHSSLGKVVRYLEPELPKVRRITIDLASKHAMAWISHLPDADQSKILASVSDALEGIDDPQADCR